MPPETMGIRHVALKVKDMAAARAFYVGVLGYKVEWEPDPENLYLTSGQDNLALHLEPPPLPGERHPAPMGAGNTAAGALDHFGIILRYAEDVDAWADHLRTAGVAIAKEPKTHRDGARSFYVKDPEGNVLQFIHHPPISGAVPWHMHPGWIAVLTIFALGPFGAPLVWRTPKLSRNGKIVGTLLVALYTGWLVLTLYQWTMAAKQMFDSQIHSLGITPEELQKVLQQGR